MATPQRPSGDTISKSSVGGRLKKNTGSSKHSRAYNTLLPKATFTPFIQTNLGLPLTSLPLASAFKTLPAQPCAAHAFFRCPNHRNTLWSSLLANSLGKKGAAPHLSSLWPFVSLIANFSALNHKHIDSSLIPLASAKCKTDGTISPSFKHFLVFKNHPLLLKVKSSKARSLPVENLLPQNVGSIITYLQ